MMIDVDLLLTYGATYKKISKGEIIFTEGDNCSFYYQLLTGRVNWLNINDDGNEFIQMLIYPGEGLANCLYSIMNRMANQQLQTKTV